MTTYYDTREAAAYVRMSQSTLEKLRLSGEGPAYSQPHRKIAYNQADLDAWMVAHRKLSTSAPASAGPRSHALQLPNPYSSNGPGSPPGALIGEPR